MGELHGNTLTNTSKLSIRNFGTTAMYKSGFVRFFSLQIITKSNISLDLFHLLLHNTMRRCIFLMVFSSLLFLCLFLPLNLAAYYIPSKTPVRNAVMLVFSLVFYAWGEPVYVLLLMFMTFACWMFALVIEKHRVSSHKKAKAALICACIVALGLIGVFKYGAFILLNIKSLTGLSFSVPQPALPIGISFYTFQLLTYVVDVYRDDAVAQKNYFNLLLYASLFHQCIAGPIVRYSHIANEITERHPSINEFNKGVMRFSAGLAKKVLLANFCGSFSGTLLLSDSAMADTSLLAENISKLSCASALTLWAGMLFYMLQIYLDFSAYSDMAIGMGLMTGFHYRENFDYPYASKSVSEFWRRWHISLGSFFRDYVYIPLGGNKKGTARTIFNLFIVWALTGLWHGAAWNYILWGLYFFVFIAAEKLFMGKILKKIPPLFSRIYLLAVVYFGWILFRFENVSMISTVIRGMLCLNGNPLSTHEAVTYISGNIVFIFIACIACTPLVSHIKKLINHYSVRYQAVNVIYSAWRVVIPAVLVVLSAICLVGNSYNPFLYFRF